MSMQTAANRFIVPPKLKSVGFYQELLKGISNYEQLGSKLIRFSEQARALRQFDLLSEYARLLSNLPVEKFQTIAQYYLALGLCRYGHGELDKAKTILENVASVAPLKYRAQAMITLSAISWDTNQPGDTLKYCVEARKIGKFDLTAIQALRGVAVLKSREGFHRSSLYDLENLYPLIKYAPPHIYLDYLNSLAVELGACGRLEEARNITKITCSSPLIVVYPEWQDTANDLALRGRPASRSVVALPKAEYNVTSLCSEGRPVAHQQASPARVLDFQKWIDKMPKKKKNGPPKFTKEQIKNMTLTEKQAAISRFIFGDQIDEEALDKMLEAIEGAVGPRQD
jgi:tetratricopeptide (TPR) repeat protein